MQNKPFIVLVFILSNLFLFSINCNNFLDKYGDGYRDTEAPVADLINTPPNFTNSTGINITVAGSDVVSYRYNLDGTGWSNEIVIADPIAESGLIDGSHTLEVIGADFAGNWQSEGSATACVWSIDTEGPVGTLFTINNGNAVTNLYWVGLYMDITGADEMRFRNEGGDWSAWEPYTDLKKWLISDQISHKHVFAQFRDLAGNIYESDDEIEFNTKIIPFNTSIGFGECVSISSTGDAVAVGAFRDGDKGVYSGSAYIYRWDGSEVKLTASDGLAYDDFGDSISISPDGNIVVIGAAAGDGNLSDTGAVYLYTWNGNDWDETKFTASDGEDGDNFGWNGVSISADENIIVVGADRDDDNGNNSGSAYIYRWNANTWQERKLLAFDGTAGDGFGRSVSISSDGNTVIIGALGAGDGGSVYLYKWDGSNWQVTTKLSPFDSAGVIEFGWGVSISSSGDTIAVGAGGNDAWKGSIYIFNWDGNNWIETELTASDGQRDDRFGWGAISISSDGNTVITGAGWDDNDNGTDSGSAYIYMWDGSIWQERKLTAPDGTPNDIFGDNDSVAISGDGNTVVVGATFDGSGSAYIFRWNDTDWIDY